MAAIPEGKPRHPAAAATLQNGWIHTRDIGKFDSEGYLYIFDRKSDMITTGGYNVYSAEVDAELQRIDGVGQVVVIGIPDPDWGEAMCACIVRNHASPEGRDLNEARVLAAAHDLLGAYKRPKRAVFMEEIPLTPFGKADKKQLRAPFWEGTVRDQSRLGVSPVFSMVHCADLPSGGRPSVGLNPFTNYKRRSIKNRPAPPITPYHGVCRRIAKIISA